MTIQNFLIVILLVSLNSCSTALRPERDSLLTLTSSPEGASIYEVNRDNHSLKELGQTPYKLSKTAKNKHTFLYFQVEKQGHVPQFIVVELTQNHHHKIHVKLKNLANWSDEAQNHTTQLLQSFGEKQNQVNSLVKAKRHKEALVLINQLVSDYPKVSILYQMRGSIHLLMNQKTSAIKDYERAQVLAPQNIELKNFIRALKSEAL